MSAVAEAIAPADVRWTDDVLAEMSGHIGRLPASQNEAVVSLTQPILEGTHAVVTVAIFFLYYNAFGRTYTLDKGTDGAWAISSTTDGFHAF